MPSTHFLVAAATLVRPRHSGTEARTSGKPGIPLIHLRASVVRPELVGPDRGKAEHVRRHGNIGERELIANNPRSSIENAFEVIEEILNRLSRLSRETASVGICGLAAANRLLASQNDAVR
jgi:hypothetical protein